MKYVVVDLEMNPVSRKDFREVKQKLNDEVIEIGAVKLDASFRRESTFRRYVKPQYNTICRHITRLTGITQETVDGQEPFEPCFRAFVDWIGEEETKIYSWSTSDISQLKHECAYKLPSFDRSWLTSRWVDLQQKFDDRLGLYNNLALQYALGAMNLEFKGTQHTALDDAINTSEILVLMQDDEKFRKTMQPVIDILKPKEDLSSSIGDLCPELLELQKKL